VILRGFLMADLLPAPLSEGYRYFVPHGRAISLCTAKFNAGA